MAQRIRGGVGSCDRRATGAFCRRLQGQVERPWLLGRSVTCELRHMARLSRWLEERRLGAADLSKERLEEFLGELPRRRDGGHVCSKRALIQMLEVLAERGVERPRVEAAATSPSDALLARFERFLLQERAVASSTASVYVERARRFP